MVLAPLQHAMNKKEAGQEWGDRHRALCQRLSAVLR